MDRFTRILETDDWVVDYDRVDNRYRAAYFVGYNFVDEIWFDGYLVRCKDCIFKHYSESNNLWCNIFEKIMPEDGYCCFGDSDVNLAELDEELVDKINSIGCTSFRLTPEECKGLLNKEKELMLADDVFLPISEENVRKPLKITFNGDLRDK